MPINQMAWVASSTGFLLMAGSGLWEAPAVMRLDSMQMVDLTIAATNQQSTNQQSTSSLPNALADQQEGRSQSSWVKLVAINPDAPKLAKLSLSTWGRRGDQDKSATPTALSAAPSSRTWLNCPTPADQLSLLPTADTFPVVFQGCPVAQLTDQAAVASLQQRLLSLAADPQTNWSALQPDLRGANPVVRLGDEVLMTISSALADRLDQHPHDLAVKWANYLRQLMGVAPIDMAAAQQRMYGLAPTETVITGAASWYGPYFHGRMTANGEIFNQYDLTAAHRDLPLGTFVKVTNQRNGRSVVVRINDRGPYYDEDHRVLDLSYQAARVLGGDEKGVMPIALNVLKPLSQPNAVEVDRQTIAFFP
jgi:Lytic transglycolase